MVSSLQPQLMSVQVSVQELFSMCLFEVPSYQRAYAWEQEQWDELWEDIHEGMRTETTHFLGTVIMAEVDSTSDSEGRRLRGFQLVDGQQRATTLCLLLLAVYDRVRQHNGDIARGLLKDFIEHEPQLQKLHLGNLNAGYFTELIQAVQNSCDLPEDPDGRSTNTRLRDALRRFLDLIEGWLQGGNGKMGDLASYVREQLYVLRFVTTDKSLAIKTFQTVNDRGKKLSLLDKSKSFLMFYITRYLDNNQGLFQNVEESFGQVFDSYDAIKDLAQCFGVNYLISTPRFRFNEDEFLRYAYHYGARETRERFNLKVEYEYEITPERGV